MSNKYKNKIITIPNILSLLRLAMIPIFVICYIQKSNYRLTAIILVISGITDVIDGIIARKYAMVSDFGKALDPVADKLTQLAMLFCLITRFPHMMFAFAFLLVKEVFTGILGLIAIRKTKTVYSAKWYGKLTTVLLYGMMVIHLIWYNIPSVWSDSFIAICIGCMLMSFVLYVRRYIKMIKG